MPLASQLRAVDVPLTNMTIGVFQDQASFLSAHFKTIPVADRAGIYYEYLKGKYNAPQMKPRGPGAESAGGDWELGTGTYTCVNEAVHYDQDWDNLADADDQVNPDRDAADFLGNQLGMRMDQKISSLLADSTWTTDANGVASGGDWATPTFNQFDASGSDPQATALDAHTSVRTLTGNLCNTFIAGMDVHKALVTNAITREAVKYTSRTSLAELHGAIAGFLGVDKYIVAGSFYNSANEGQADSMAQILNPKDAWMGYVSQNPGLRTLSAFNVFGFNGGGKSMKTKGVAVRTFDMEHKSLTRRELSLDVDVKVVSADCGVFLDAAVS